MNNFGNLPFKFCNEKSVMEVVLALLLIFLHLFHLHDSVKIIYIYRVDKHFP